MGSRCFQVIQAVANPARLRASTNVRWTAKTEQMEKGCTPIRVFAPCAAKGS